MTDQPESTTGKIEWDFEIPLLTNPLILLDFLKVLVIAFVAMTLLVTLISAFEGTGGFKMFVPLIELLGVCLLVVGVIMVFVMLVIYRNRFHCRFVVDDKGVAYCVTSAQRKLNTATIVIGALAGKPGAVGAGMIARSQEHVSYTWADIYRADLLPNRRTVCLRNSWRTLLRVYCTPDNYEAVAAMATEGIEKATAARIKQASDNRSLRGLVIRRVAWLPLIALSAFLSTAQPLLDEKFAAVWAAGAVLAVGALLGGLARRLTGVLGLLIVVEIVIMMIANGLKVNDFGSHGLITSSGFDSAMSGGDLPIFLIGCAGLLGLLLLSVRNILSSR